MNFRTKQYLKKRFGDYYNTHLDSLPFDFTKREWAFIFFDELPDVIMRRHKAFLSKREGLEYICGMNPAHVYYSVAYYKFPNAPTMKEKEWNGADLVFDLDADHIPKKTSSYSEMLDNVKSETEKLIEFLFDDFGFTEENINIVFSGGRGYHIHIRHQKVFSLGSPERREIVDYIGGKGLSLDYFFKPAEYKVYNEGKFKKTKLESPRKISSYDEKVGGFGWGKRISQYLINYFEDISKKDDKEALIQLKTLIYEYNLKKVSSESILDEHAEKIIKIKKERKNVGIEKIATEVGIPKKVVHDFLIKNNMQDYNKEATVKLKDIKKITKTLDIIRNKGIIGDSYVFDAIVEKAIEENSVNLGGAHTDEPVTADIKRLIRMPLSLHGGSGMKVVPLSYSEFKNFSPLNDAIVFSDNEIEIKVIPPLKPQNSVVEMKHKTFKINEGINKLPEYAGIYLMCRGAAEYA